jgi:hypothetical protein
MDLFSYILVLFGIFGLTSAALESRKSEHGSKDLIEIDPLSRTPVRPANNRDHSAATEVQITSSNMLVDLSDADTNRAAGTPQVRTDGAFMGIIRIDMVIVHLYMACSGFLENMMLSSVLKNNLLAELFDGSPYANNYLIWTFGAFRVGSFISTMLMSIIPLISLYSYQKYSIVSCFFIGIGAITFIILPDHLVSSDHTPFSRLCACLAICFWIGIWVGVFTSYTYTLCCMLPESYVTANLLGFGGADILSSIIFMISASYAQLEAPNPNLNACNRTQPNSTETKNSTENCTRVNPGSSDIRLSDTSQSQHYTSMVIMLVAASVGFFLSFIFKYSLVIYHYFDDARDIRKPNFPVILNLLSGKISGLYLLAIGFLSMVFATILPLVIPNIEPKHPDKTDRLKKTLFIPAAYLIIAVVTLLAAMVTGKGFTAVYKDPLWVISTPLIVVATSVLLLLCNFRRTTPKSTSDPFPNAPRSIASDVAYFIIVALWCLFYGYSRGMIWNTAVEHVPQGAHQGKMRTLLILVTRIGLLLSPIVSMGIYSAMCD